MPASILSFLEQVRATAQSGLHHTSSPFARERFQRLLDACVLEYADLADADMAQVRSTLLQELGTITPKSAANAAVFDTSGRLLLIRRSDDGKLTMPGGACEPSEAPAEAAYRDHTRTALHPRDHPPLVE